MNGLADRRTYFEVRENTSLITDGSIKPLHTIASKHHNAFPISSTLTPIEGDDVKIVVAIKTCLKTRIDVMIIGND
jgi:hypothetical protein